MDKELSIKLYQAISDGNEERVYEHWHASSLAECPRAHYMKRLGVPSINKPTAAKILRWDAGHAFEERIRKHIGSLFEGKVISNERLTSKELDLTGEYDNKVRSTLIEVKTVHDYAFKEVNGDLYLKEQDGNHPNGNKKWVAKKTPYLHHEIQNHGYVVLLKEKDITIKEIVYIYLSLSGRVVIYRTKVQDELIDNVQKRLEVLNKAWATKTPPECICKEGHPLYAPVMNFCDYKTETDCCNINLIKEKK